MKRLLTLALAAPLILGACSQASAKDLSRKDIEAIVADYLMENPEIVEAALEELDRKRMKAQLDAIRVQLEDNPRDISMGPKDAKVTIVEFFDYNCGYCKQSTEWVRKTIDKYPDDVRVVFKELPLLDSRSRTSRKAAIAALAASRQGKYPVMHFSLMNETSLTEERIEMLAKKAGLDIEMWKKDMEDEIFQDHIEDTFRLARSLPNLTGTPYFVIGDEVIAGANVALLNETLKAALES